MTFVISDATLAEITTVNFWWRLLTLIKPKFAEKKIIFTREQTGLSELHWKSMRWTLKKWYLLLNSHATVNINSEWIQNVSIHFWRKNCQSTRRWHIKNSTIKCIVLFLDVEIHSNRYDVKCLFISYGVYQRIFWPRMASEAVGAQNGKRTLETKLTVNNSNFTF